MYNKWKRYKISRSLNGDKIVYLARYGKQNTIIGRANSKKDLIKFMSEAAEKFEEEQDELLKQAKEELAAENEKETKKPGLWKPGGMLSKKPTAAASKLAIKQAKAKKFASSKTSHKTSKKSHKTSKKSHKAGSSNG